MRLIDADALPVRKAHCVDEAGWGAAFCVVDKSDIDNAPAIEAEPVRHGRWEWFCDKESLKEYGSNGLWGYRCSLCEAYADDYGYDSKHPEDTDETPEEHLPYCPNCGAKMDLEG